MAVKIRLKRLGKIRSPHYRIVVMDSRTKRDGRAIEEIGLYHPKNEPSLIKVNSERALYWLGVGAQPTEAVVALLKRSGDWQKHSGDTSPSGIDPQKEPVNRLERYNKAVAESDGESTTDAISKGGRTSRKPAQADAAEAPTTRAEPDAAEAATGESDNATADEADAGKTARKPQGDEATDAKATADEASATKATADEATEAKADEATDEATADEATADAKATADAASAEPVTAEVDADVASDEA